MYTVELSPQPHPSYEHSPFDDDQLVIAAQCGSESAFRELYRRNSRRVYWSISRVAKDRADAEDALQDSFMRAFIHIHQFDRRSSFSTWLARIGINSALTILRKNKKKAGETSIEFVDTTENIRRELEFADPAANPEEHCLINEMTSVISRAIGQLPERLRIVTELRLNQNLTLQEISTTLHISILATKSRLHRAKQHILVFLHKNTAAASYTKTDHLRMRGHHFWQQWASYERAHARTSRKNV
jgi:RNA polymerase sigma-70 factor, ECF subfamily